VLPVGQLRFAWSPPEWVVATSLCQNAGRYLPPHGILKAGVWFRRGRLLIVSPDSLGKACPLSGRNSTYRPVQISAAGSLPPLCRGSNDPFRKIAHRQSLSVRLAEQKPSPSPPSNPDKLAVGDNLTASWSRSHALLPCRCHADYFILHGIFSGVQVVLCLLDFWRARRDSNC
jgi:hypothetical protein